MPYREGIFSTWNDPAKFGLFYHAALITRRCDVTPAQKKVAVKSQGLSGKKWTALQGILEQHQAATVFDDTLPEGFDQLVPVEETYPIPDANRIVSDNGQLWRDLKNRIGAVDTPRTKVAYGMLGLAGNISSIKRHVPMGVDLSGVQIACKTDFAVIALSSLTDDPIETSDNMLLSAIGRARNTEAVFDGEKMLDVGKPPIMAEVIQAQVRIKTCHGDKLKVWGVNAEGFYSGRLVTTYEDGVLSFNIGDEQNPACFYLIVKE